MGRGEGWRRAFTATLAALLLLEVLWEIWLAPLRPGAFWLALKALPLALLWSDGAAQGSANASWALMPNS